MLLEVSKTARWKWPGPVVTQNCKIHVTTTDHGAQQLSCQVFPKLTDLKSLDSTTGCTLKVPRASSSSINLYLLKSWLVCIWERPLRLTFPSVSALLLPWVSSALEEITLPRGARDPFARSKLHLHSTQPSKL